MSQLHFPSKILIIPPDQKSSFINRITSGQEKVARDQALLLTQMGHTVTYLTVDGLEDLSILGFTHLRMNDVKPRSFFNSNRPNPQIAPKKVWCEKIAKMDFDFIILHSDSTVFAKELCKLGLGPKIISFIHNPFAGSMYGIGFNSGQGRVKASGGMIVAVSQRCQQIWNNWHVGMRKRLLSGEMSVTRPDLINLDLFFDNFIEDVFIPQLSILDNRPIELKPTLTGVVLARIAEEKQIHRVFGYDLSFVCSEDNETYYHKILGKLNKENVYLNHSHSDAMQILGRHEFLVSTWANETSGINAFEAAERGLPSILIVDGSTHASEEFLPSWAYLKCNLKTQNFRDKLFSRPPEWATSEFRQRLASHMRKEFPSKDYSIRLVALLEKNFQNRNKVYNS